MPIFEYAPVPVASDQGDPPLSGRDCCYFEYLHIPGTSSAEPLAHCPRCGNPIQRVPARFAAAWSRPTGTGNALRSAGKADFAEAWDEAEASQQKKIRRPLICDKSEAGEKSVGERVTEVLRHHVCTASCDHGPLRRA